MDLKKINPELYRAWEEFMMESYGSLKTRSKPKDVRSLGFTATEKEISEFEQTINRNLPEDFKEFYRQYGSFVTPLDDEYWGYCPSYYANFSYIREGLTFMFPFDSFWNFDSLLKETLSLHKARAIPTSFIVVSSSQMGGNLYEYALMGIDEDNYGKIFSWQRKYTKIYDEDDGDILDQYLTPWGMEDNKFMAPIANSFTELLSQLVPYSDDVIENQAVELFALLWKIDINNPYDL